MTEKSSSFLPRRVLKLNVGFLLDGQMQQAKDMEFDLPRVRVDDDLDLEYVRGKLRVSRTREGILLQGRLLVGVDGDCHRCLEPTTSNFEIRIEELFATSDKLSMEEAEFHVHEDGQLDLAPLLRAEALIGAGHGLRCADVPACDARKRKLEEAAGIDHIDPRLAKLQELLDRKAE
ncbi:MAG: YceD family protein [Phototrophicaceae bacterium]